MTRIVKIIGINFFVIMLGTIVCGSISVYLGKELNWDLANYHYYNPYALLHQRWNYDDWPVSFINHFFSPTFDLFTYFLINSFSPKIVTFLLGAIHGLNFWVLFCIAYYLVREISFFNQLMCALIAMILSALGLYAPTSFNSIGSLQQDELASLFILGFVLLQLHIWTVQMRNQSIHIPLFCMSSLILGIGVGGKLTTALFVGGSLFSFFFVAYIVGRAWPNYIII